MGRRTTNILFLPSALVLHYSCPPLYLLLFTLYVNKWGKKPQSFLRTTWSLMWRTATNLQPHLFWQALQKAAAEKGRGKQNAFAKLPRASASLLSVFEPLLIRSERLQTKAAQRWISGRFGGGCLAAGWWRGEGGESALPLLGSSEHLLWYWRLPCPAACRGERKIKGGLGLLPLEFGK